MKLIVVSIYYKINYFCEIIILRNKPVFEDLLPRGVAIAKHNNELKQQLR